MQINLIDKLTADPEKDMEYLVALLDNFPDTAENYTLRTTAMQLIAQINENKKSYSQKTSMEKCDALINAGKFEECLTFINPIIDTFDLTYENDNQIFLRFRDIIEFCIYVEKNNNEQKENNKTYTWVDFYDVYILQKKAFCLFELKKFDESLELCKTINKLAPMYAGNSIEIAEIYKAQGQFDKYKEQLDNTVNIAWLSTDIAKLIRAYAFYYTEMKDYEKAIALLDVSRAYDNSEKAIAYLNNEVGYIKLIQPEIKVLPPQENLKFLQENNLYYAPSQETKTILMRAYKSLLTLMSENKIQPNICAFFATNFLTITLGEQELLDIVEADVFRKKALVINKKFGYSFEISREWNEMNEKGYEAFNLSKNTTSFLFIAKDNKLEKTISITHDTTFNPKSNEDYQMLIDRNNKILRENNFNVEKYGILEFPNGLRVQRFILTDKDGIKVMQYMFKMRPDLLGCLSYKIDEENEIEKEVLSIFNSFRYLGFKKDPHSQLIRNFFLRVKAARKNNADLSSIVKFNDDSIKRLFTFNTPKELCIYVEEIIKSAIYTISMREESVEEVSYTELKEFLAINKNQLSEASINNLLEILLKKSDNFFPILNEILNKTEQEKIAIYNALAQALLI